MEYFVIYVNTISISEKMLCLQMGTRKNFVYDGSFNEAIGPVLAMGQFFAVMPVIGVQLGSASKLRYSWISIRTMYSIVVFFLTIGYTILTVYRSLDGDLEFDKIGKKKVYLNIMFLLSRRRSVRKLTPLDVLFISLQFQSYFLDQFYILVFALVNWQFNGRH